MNIDFLIKNFEKNKNHDALIYLNKIYKYEWIVDKIKYYDDKFSDLPQGSVITIESDFCPATISLFISLVKNNHIIVPLTSISDYNKKQFIEISKSQYYMKLEQTSDKINLEYKKLDFDGQHNYYTTIRNRNSGGLVVFSSGSTGDSKASVHDIEPIFDKFKVKKRKFRSLIFLLFDHLGGINTILYTLSNGGCAVIPNSKKVDYVLKLIEDFNVELLPTTPSFLNVILFSEKYKQYDLSSLKIISYGTEVMHKNTLKKLNTIFPNIRLLQTYGLSELGVMRSQSENNSSLWVKIGGEQFKTRVVNDKLEIKSESAMLGYLNAKSPFTDDGWFKTNDLVETKGEFFKILGRQSEIINVGGQKVYPSEIENLLLEMEDVEDISIYGESNVLMGQVVCAKVKINHKNKKLFRKKMRVYCKGKIEKYKIPTKIYFTDDKIYNNRFKRIRR